MYLFLYATDSEQSILETIQILTCPNDLAPVPLGRSTICDYLQTARDNAEEMLLTAREGLVSNTSRNSSPKPPRVMQMLLQGINTA
jgi:hypothetical protein